MLEADPTARISAFADIELSVRGSRYVIGARTVIDSFVKIKPAGGSGDIVIGEDCVINSGTVIYSGNGVYVGNAVLIAANCTLAATNHEFSDPDARIRDQGFQPTRGGIVINDDVWLGANVVVLDGAEIGTGAVIGAGSVVRGVIEPYGLYAGVPATRRGSRRPE